ncbi:uncharacterized protein LOC132193202 [Neocloeon triangulifer]|uniref:uncharacterized protein LOC132193202 n=1 Tax=Neocloeon triangulifer TaxID=2078957 RepID=UPI00286F50A7|nr:uncharacterized protein LOC132193202 [Neocloeon triangulifer]
MRSDECKQRRFATVAGLQNMRSANATDKPRIFRLLQGELELRECRRNVFLAFKKETGEVPKSQNNHNTWTLICSRPVSKSKYYVAKEEERKKFKYIIFHMLNVIHIQRVRVLLEILQTKSNCKLDDDSAAWSYLNDMQNSPITKRRKSVSDSPSFRILINQMAVNNQMSSDEESQEEETETTPLGICIKVKGGYLSSSSNSLNIESNTLKTELHCAFSQKNLSKDAIKIDNKAKTAARKPCWPNSVIHILVLILALTIIAVTAFTPNMRAVVLSSVFHQNAQLNNKNGKEIIENLQQLKALFPNQSNNFWNSLEAGFKDLEQPDKPKPMITLLVHSPDEAQLAHCLAGKLTGLVHSDPVYVKTSNLKHLQEYGNLIEQLQTYLTKENSVIVKDLHRLPGRLALALHVICDRESPLANLTMVTMTLEVDDLSSKAVQELLSTLWAEHIDADKMPALLTRIVSRVLKVEKQQALPKFCN